MSNSKEPQRIVLAAVGLHMVERIVGGVQGVQAKQGKVDRVLLVTKDGKDRAAALLPELRAMLGDNWPVDMEECNIFDQGSCFQLLDKVYTREVRAGNQVVLLMGTGSQLFAGVAYATASRHGQPIFYLEWLDPGEMGPARVDKVDPFPPPAPDEDILVVLNYIASKKGNGRTDIELTKFLKQSRRPENAHEQGLEGNTPGVRRRGFIEKLMKQGYISPCPPEGEVSLREMVLELTPYGRTMQSVYGHRFPKEMWVRDAGDAFELDE